MLLFRWLSKFEMKLAKLAKYGVLVLILVYLGLMVNRYVTVNKFDNEVTLGALSSLMVSIFFISIVNY